MNNGYFSSPSDNNSQQMHYNVEGYKTIKQKYTKKQASVLTVSLLTAGIGFLYVAVLGLLLEYLVFNPILLNPDATIGQLTAANAILTIASVGIIIGIIMSFIWSFRLYKASLAFGIVTIFIYASSFAVGFGSLFSYIEAISDEKGLSIIMSAFGLVGVIFLGAFAVAKLLSIKGIITLTKLIIATSAIAFVAYLAFMIWALIGMQASYARTVSLIINGLFCLLSIFLLVSNIWKAQNMDKFYLPNELNAKMGLFIGFQILVSLITILYTILRIFAASSRG